MRGITMSKFNLKKKGSGYMRTDRVSKFFYKWGMGMAIFTILLAPVIVGVLIGAFTSIMMADGVIAGFAVMMFGSMPIIGAMSDREEWMSGDWRAYGLLVSEPKLGWILRQAYNTREGLIGTGHARYAAALVPGDENGITSLVIGCYQPNETHPSLVHAEQIKVGHDPDPQVIEHVLDRFTALQRAAWSMEEDHYLEAVPKRRTELALQVLSDKETALEARLCRRQQQVLADLVA
jgi:hypothetical protein